MNLIILLLFGVSIIITFFNKRAGYLAIIFSSVAAIIVEIMPFSITSFFFIIAGIVWALASWYSLSYDDYGKWLSMTFSISIFGIVLILQSNNYLEFLVGWEIMSLGGYMAIGINSSRAKPAFLFSAFSELGTVFIIAGFIYAFSISGTLEFTPLSSDIPLILTSLGFLMKMGSFPFMLSEWLPISHGNAPANLSILLSATMTLMGVFGILRMAILSPSNLYFGMVLMSIGAFSVFFGALFAYTSENTKMLPGFSTIDSNGGMLVGLGLLVATVSQYEKGFLISAVLLFALSHSISKTGLFMISGQSRKTTLSEYDGNKNIISAIGTIFVASSLSGLLPTVGGVAVWMLLESLFMQSIQFHILGVFSIIIGSVVALGEGLITGSMIKFVSFTQLLKEKGNTISGLSFPLLSSGILVVLFGIIATLLVGHSFVSGNILVGIPYGFLLITSLTPGSLFGVVSPLFVFLLVIVFSIMVLGIFGPPKIRRVKVWNGGVPLDSKYNSFAYSNNMRIMLKKIVKPFNAEIRNEDGVINIFWDAMIFIGGLFRKVARSLVYAIMNSSMTWYMVYIIVAFFIALILGVAIYE